jgi:hypothetical protein
MQSGAAYGRRPVEMPFSGQHPSPWSQFGQDFVFSIKVERIFGPKRGKIDIFGSLPPLEFCQKLTEMVKLQNGWPA